MAGCAGCLSATLQCIMGAAPMPHVVLPTTRVMISKKPAANIMSQIPMGNIVPFVTCKVLTAIALGVPMPCTPATVAPWIPGNPRVLIGGMPTQDQSSTLVCMIGGMISTLAPGQFQVMI